LAKLMPLATSTMDVMEPLLASSVMLMNSLVSCRAPLLRVAEGAAKDAVASHSSVSTTIHRARRIAGAALGMVMCPPSFLRSRHNALYVYRAAYGLGHTREFHQHVVSGGHGNTDDARQGRPGQHRRSQPNDAGRVPSAVLV